MESTPRTIKHLVNDLELRLKDIQTTRIHDEFIKNFEQLLNDCLNHFEHVQKTDDATFVAFILPTITQTLISLNRLCSDKLSQDLILKTKTLLNQIKEFFKSKKVNDLFEHSNQKRNFCEQVFGVIESSGNDIGTGFTLYKCIVKLIAETDKNGQVICSDTEDSFSYTIYQGTLKQVTILLNRSSQDTNNPLTVLKVNQAKKNKLENSSFFLFGKIDVWSLFSNNRSFSTIEYNLQSNRKFH